MTFYQNFIITKTLFVILKLLLLHGNISTSVKRTATFETREGYRLTGKIIQEVRNLSLSACAQRCLHHTECQSTNAFVGTGKMPFVDICQLLSENQESNINGLLPSHEWIYSDIKVRVYKKIPVIDRNSKRKLKLWNHSIPIYIYIVISHMVSLQEREECILLHGYLLIFIL